VKLSDNAGEDSASLLPVLEDPSKNLKRSAIISHSINGRFAISDGQWKLIMPHGKLGYELYNLKRDPGEDTNQYGKHKNIQNRLEKRITAMVQNGRTTPGSNQKNDVSWWQDLTWISN
jgi:arylsulfatase A